MASANTIDISEFQDPSVFDYQAAKNAGINTIIIRGSVSMRLDKHAKEHIANAKKYGFHWHLYHYYYGGSGEADFAVQAAQELGLSSSQYLFLDMEDKSLPNDWATSFEIFRKKAQSHFKVGLYCSDSPYQAKFNDSTLKQEGVARWVASYSYEPKNYDIWQMSGVGSGGFGSYNHDVDRDYDKTGLLTGGSSEDHPKTPTGPTSDSSSDQPNTPTGPANPGYRAIILDYGIDTETGVYGRGYSYDNGKTFYVTDTTYGRKYRQEDADRIAPFLKKYFNPAGPDLKKYFGSGPITSSIAWADILDKPDLATQDDLKAIKLTPGPPGPPGKDGSPGKDGKSAYQIAVDHGFVGSEAEWLQSLHGKDGAATSGGDASLSIEAITELIKDHIHATVDTTNGQLTVSTDNVDNGSIADAVAAKVASSMSWKLSTDGELIAEMGGE